MELSAGTQLKSAVSATQVIVVRAAGPVGELACGGLPMIGRDEPSPGGEIQPGSEGSVLLGKRYIDQSGTVEVLCTVSGEGVLALDGQPLDVKTAKPLPSSD